MDDALKLIYSACDPEKPATPQYYVDCGISRGETGFANHFINHLEGLSEIEGKYLRFLFSGHVGCGKSSELQHLCYILKNQDSFSNKFYPILLDVSDYLDDYDVSITDILLAVVTEIADTLRKELNYELKDTYFKKRFEEIKEFFLSDIEINEGEFEWFGAKLKVQRLKKNPEARQKVREKLQPQSLTMLEEINRVFEEARLAVKRQKDSLGRRIYQDLILVFDNLEKIRKFEKVEEGLSSQKELFLERYTQLTGLQAHVVYTVPLRLVRSVDGPQLLQRYGQEPFVLPMVKVIERGSRTGYKPGMKSIRDILSKRLGGLELEKAFEADALDFLLKYSGGHTRNLVSFVQNACTYSNKIPITIQAVQKAVQQTVRTYSTAIPESHWDKLAQLDLSPDQKIINGDDDYLKMLENLSVLEYLNGGSEDFVATAEPWYAVTDRLINRLTSQMC